MGLRWVFRRCVIVGLLELLLGVCWWRRLIFFCVLSISLLLMLYLVVSTCIVVVYPGLPRLIWAHTSSFLPDRKDIVYNSSNLQCNLVFGYLSVSIDIFCSTSNIYGISTLYTSQPHTFPRNLTYDAGLNPIRLHVPLASLLLALGGKSGSVLPIRSSAAKSQPQALSPTINSPQNFNIANSQIDLHEIF